VLDKERKKLSVQVHMIPYITLFTTLYQHAGAEIIIIFVLNLFLSKKQDYLAPVLTTSREKFKVPI